MDSVPQQAVQDIGQIDRADLVIGIIADLSRENVAEICEALGTLPGNPRIVVLQNRSDAPPVGSTPAQASSLSLIAWPLQNQGSPTTPVEGMLASYQSILTIGEELGARGCCVIASKLEHAPSRWVCQLAAPLLEASCDFIAPSYARRKFDGLLNSSIVSPLTRSLYGLRLQNPMGPDLGISQKLFPGLLDRDQDGKAGGKGMHLLASLVPLVLCGDLEASQAYLGVRSYPPSDWTYVSSLLSEILGPIFWLWRETQPVGKECEPHVR